MNLYLALKIAHLLSIVLWIGPPLAAYLFVYFAWREDDKSAAARAKIAWTERLCERVIVLEHIALVVMLGSGVAMLSEVNWAYLSADWMRIKLGFVAYVLFFEIVDMWISHRILKRAFAHDDFAERPGWARAKRARLVLMALAAPVAFACIPAIFYLAVTKG